MDREAIARARRRQQVLDAIEFERSREEALLDELGDRIAEVEGPRIDEEVFSRLEASEVELIRPTLSAGFYTDTADDELFTLEDSGEEETGEGWAEEEIARLQGEIERCRSRLLAYERYLAALGPAAPP